MSKLTIAPLAAGFRSSNRLNDNFAAIEAALENTLSRDGSTPNEMLADLDMNSQRILNLPLPTEPSDPVRLADIHLSNLDIVSDLVDEAEAALDATLTALEGLPIDLRTFGGTIGGVVDNGDAFVAAFEDLAATGGRLVIPQGTTLLTAATIASGDNPVGFKPPTSLIIEGHGPQSKLRIKRTNFGSFYGFGIENADVTFRDMTFEVEVNGGNWCAVASLIGASSNVTFERCVFKGIGSIVGTYGIVISNKDFDRISWIGCHFENMELPFSKAIEDFSTQTNILARDCTATDCTEVFEFNSPGIFEGTLNTGSPVITAPRSSLGAFPALNTDNIPVGAVIRMRGLPSGTTVLSKTANTITVSNDATITEANVRASIGGIKGIRIPNLRVSNMEQWAVGLANCEDFEVDVYGEDCQLDLVHVEDHSRKGKVKVGGKRINLNPAGFEGPNNGAVLIITGSHDVEVDLGGLDLTQNPTGTPKGLYVGAGTAGTTNTVDACYDIRVKGRVPVNEDSQYAYVNGMSTPLEFVDGAHAVSDSSSIASPVMTILNAQVSGTFKVTEPGVIIATDNGFMGTFDKLHLITEGEDFDNLEFTSGITALNRNQPVMYTSATFRCNPTVDTGATWRTLQPAPYNCDMKMSRKVIGTPDHGYETGTIQVVNGLLQPLFSYEVDQNFLTLNPGTVADLVTTGTTAAGDSLISALASMANIVSGQPVSGAGIPDNSKVILNAVNAVRISSSMTASATVPITFKGYSLTTHGWRIDGGKLQFRAFASPSQAAKMIVTVDGPMVPAA